MSSRFSKVAATIVAVVLGGIVAGKSLGGPDDLAARYDAERHGNTRLLFSKLSLHNDTWYAVYDTVSGREFLAVRHCGIIEIKPRRLVAPKAGPQPSEPSAPSRKPASPAGPKALCPVPSLPFDFTPPPSTDRTQ